MYQGLAILDRHDDIAKLVDGTEVVVTQSNYRSLLPKYSNPIDRESIFKAAYTRYVDNKNAFATLYGQVIKTNHQSALARGFKSALDAKLFTQNTPNDVFMNLIEVAKEASPHIREYISLRKKALKLDTYHTYDRFLSIKEIDSNYTYEEAKAIVLKAFENEDVELKTNVAKALEDGYVDVYPKPYKRTGAYSNSIYGYHPIILLNHDNTLDSIFTVAHEAGHSSHSIFSSSNQSYALADYEIFVAEIASTFNEHLLLDYLISVSTNKDEKIVLVENAIDMIMSTFFRQTLFATFEYEANQLIINNQIINEQSLSQIMINLYKHYYGIDITKEQGKQYVWAYIPHLYYSPYYVYQYSTSFAASLQIYANVRKDKEKGYENFKKLLKAGSSDYPFNIVKNAGVDLSKKESYNAVVERFISLTKELKKLLGE
jgi:oligoendopeptidase F